MKIQNILATFLLLSLSITANAASVQQVKGNKALISLDGDNASEGQEFFSVNPTTNKKNAILRIKQVKSGKAIAEVVKGNPSPGSYLQPKGSAMSSGSSRDDYSRGSEGGTSNMLKNSWGVNGQFINASMEATFTRSTPSSHTATATMAGSGLGAGAFYNYVYSKNITAYLETSLQQFQTTGSTTLTDCDNSTTCDVKIMYLSFYGLGRYYFSTTKYRPWVGAGGGFLLALSKSSSVLNSSQISTNQVLSMAGGLDYQLNKKNYFPFSIQYDLFPASNTVKANMLTVRLGYGWNF